MQITDVAIVGGGMAGATAAAMLGRMGIPAILIDPHAAYPADFRCEKLDDLQVRLLKQTGLGDDILPAARRAGEILICRNGRLVERRPVGQYSAPYETFVNAARAAIGGTASLLVGKVREIAAGPDRQTLTLTNGETLSARLVVLANGLNQGLRASLGFVSSEISNDHSLSIGFDLSPVGSEAFPFVALTWYPEDIRQRIAYLSLFPFEGALRANLFAYRAIRDPWVQRLRELPTETLRETFPKLASMTGPYAVSSPVQVRPAHLYVTEQRDCDGVVLVGDAFGTSCPVAGTGFNKVFTDVERLCHVHIPRWLSTPGMTAAKIASFYRDPVKGAADASSLSKAMLTKKAATENSLRWRSRRVIRYAGQLAVGALREWRAQWMAPAAPRFGDTK